MSRASRLISMTRKWYPSRQPPELLRVALDVDRGDLPVVDGEAITVATPSVPGPAGRACR